MEINNVVEITVLMGYYGSLLTEKQQRYLTAYIEEDYSLSEIAKDYEVSRQAVYDQIKKGVQQLYEIEAKLNFVERDETLKKCLDTTSLTLSEREKILSLL